jgi:polyribonucleotide nucleotidyltransferase
LTNCPVYEKEKYKGKIRKYDGQKSAQPWMLTPTRCTQVCKPFKRIDRNEKRGKRLNPLEKSVGCEYYKRDKPLHLTNIKEMLYQLKPSPLAQEILEEHRTLDSRSRTKVKVAQL